MPLKRRSFLLNNTLCNNNPKTSVLTKSTRGLSKRANLPNPRDPPLIEQKKSSRLRWWHLIFIFSGISLLLCLLQICLPPPFGLCMTSAEVSAVGIAPGCDNGMDKCVCPRRTICATNRTSMVLLVLARCSVFFDYPLYMMIFLSKAHNLNNILRRTILREFIDFGDMHHIHSMFGIIVGVETMIHTFFHVLRWGMSGDINLLWKTATGVTGIIAAEITPLIVWPMVIPLLKHIKFELRKGLHYLAWVWALVLCWHAPSRIFYLIGVPFAVYVLDFFVGFFVRNHLKENVYFERYGGNGIALNFENPHEWHDCSKTSYIYIMCPWVSKWQWHAFTIFPDPSKPNHTMLAIGTSGDWTKQIYDKIKVPCHRSIYVIGPFMSEFSDSAVNTTNAIAVASGIGITPTLSLMLSYAGKKRINIIWMCRDPGLIEYFLHKVDMNAVTLNSFAFIFYTGERDLVLPKDLPVNFFIFRSRPKLEEIISGIVTAIHSGDGLPEEMYENQKAIANIPFRERIKIALSRIVTIYSKEEMFSFAVAETITELAAKGQGDLEVGESDITIELEGSESESAQLVDIEDDCAVSPHELHVSGEGDIVSLKGLESMIQAFLGGIGECSQSDMEKLFEMVDADNSGFINKKEFDDFISLITREKHDDNMGERVSKVLQSRQSIHNFRGIDSAQSALHSMHEFIVPEPTLGNEYTIKYVKNLVDVAEKPLDDWGIFYCGASTSVESTLRSIAKKYKFGSVAVEKFNW